MKYILIKEKLLSIDVGEYTGYGIELQNEDGEIIKRISDIDIHKREVEKLCRLCNKLKLSEIHFLEVVEDYLTK